MNEKTTAKHIKALQKLFPDAFISSTKEWNGREGGLWTGFGAHSEICDYWNSYVNPKLQTYLDKNGLFIEPNDPETYMIWAV
jgi:hypothetical protein